MEDYIDNKEHLFKVLEHIHEMNSLLSCHVKVSFVGESGHIVHNIKLADFGVQGTPLRLNISHFHAIFGKIDQLQGLALLVRLRLLGSLVMLY